MSNGCWLISCGARWLFTGGLVANNALGRQGLVFYILAYSVMTVGAFGVVMALEGPQREGLRN